MKHLLLILGLIPLFSLAQSEGIKFDANPFWNEIITKAKKENKYIFVDCYTTWCGPCKYMSQKIFTQSPVGQFFNSNFVNISLQMDRTTKDPEEIRSRYSLADSINEKYAVNAYPTYLIFSPDGNAVDRFVGSFEEANDFIARAKESLLPAQRYYTTINNYKDHLGDSGYLRNALSMAVKADDNLNSANIADDYFGSLKDSFSVDNIQFLQGVRKIRFSGKVFNFYLRNASKINHILGRDSVIEYILCGLIRSEQVVPLLKMKDTILNYTKVLHYFQDLYPSLRYELPIWISTGFDYEIKKSIIELYQKGSQNPDWNAIANNMSIRYPGYDCARLVDQLKPGYYKSMKMWPQWEKCTLSFLSRYGDKLDAGDINKSVWDLFMYSSSQESLRIALTWSNRCIELSQGQCEYMDTYANLLYKTGNLQNALIWEKKAVDKCGSSNAEIRSNFEKMKNNIKTWAVLKN